MSPNQNPEQIARDRIDDDAFQHCRWAKQNKAKFLFYHPSRFSLLAFLSFWFFLAPSVKAQFLEITCDKPQLVYNDHVGNEWSFAFELGEKYFNIATVNNFTLAELSKVRLIVSEANEKYIDYGVVTLGIDPGTLEWNKLYTKILEVIIKERNGRYAGNTAKWKVIIQYRKVHGRA